MNVTNLLLAKEARPDLSAWAFEEELTLAVKADLFDVIEAYWNDYLGGGSHETFVESLRRVLSTEYRTDTANQILKDWSGE